MVKCYRYYRGQYGGGKPQKFVCPHPLKGPKAGWAQSAVLVCWPIRADGAFIPRAALARVMMKAVCGGNGGEPWERRKKKSI